MPKVTAELYCSICFNDEETQDWTSLVACGHLFHEACIRRWVTPPPPLEGERKSKKPDFCPLCRVKIVRPLGNNNNKKTSRENSRFRKLVFGSDVRLDLSSSPVRVLPSQDVVNVDDDDDNNGEGSSRRSSTHTHSSKRNVMIIQDSDASEDELDAMRQGDMLQPLPPFLRQAIPGTGTILTESESDEENARPAQRVHPRRRTGEARDTTPLPAAGLASTSSVRNDSTHPDNNTNAALSEARAAIAAKNVEIANLRNELMKASEELQESNEAHNRKNEELEMIEIRLRERNHEFLKTKEEIAKLKEEKKGLSRTLRSEVERVGSLNSANRNLLEEITLLKQEHTQLKARYEELEESFNSTVDDLTTRAQEAESARDLSKSHFTRIHDLNKRNEIKLDKKRAKIAHLEAELSRYKDADGARRREKGKGRAIVYEDDQGDTGHHNEGDGNLYAYAVPRARPGQVSNRSRPVDVDDTSILLDAQNEDFEESLIVTQIPDSEGQDDLVHIGDDADDEDAFADLDAILSVPKPVKRRRPNTQGILSRDPLKEWTNSEKINGKGRLEQQQQYSNASYSSNKDVQKRSLTSISHAPSDKWADMAIYGKNRNGKSTTASAAGEKKKTRTVF